MVPHHSTYPSTAGIQHGGSSSLPKGDSMVLVMLGLKALVPGAASPHGQQLSFSAWQFLKQKFSWRSLSGEVERE